MTEFELIEVWALATEGLGAAGMNIVTVVFAYVIAAHLAGGKFNRLVAVSISVVYSMWLVGPFIGFISYLNLSHAAAIDYMTMFPDGTAIPDPQNLPVAVVLAAGPYVLGWIGSLMYMHWYIRGNKRLNANSA